jgi:hypothetical protein
MCVVGDVGGQARLDAATGNRDRLRRKSDQRLEITEELKQNVVDL